MAFSMLNSYRTLMTAAGEDPTVSFEEQLAPLSAEHLLDIQDLLRVVRDNHPNGQIYNMDQEAVARVVHAHKELKALEQAAVEEGFGSLLEGMYKKSLTNLLKLSMVVACVREALAFKAIQAPPSFKVLAKDVEASWILVQDSAHCFKVFKVRGKDIFILNTLHIHRYS